MTRTTALRPLSMRETLACIDINGRVRCPTCGKFTKMDCISRDNHFSGPGISVSLFPRCDRCRAREV